MKLPRRRFLQLAGAAATAPTLPQPASAQAYPARPVRIVVGFAAAGTNDIVARLIAQWLSERLGQQFVIENRPGAGGNIGAEAAVNAPADGYTLLMVGPAQAINATLYDKLSFVFLRDIAPVAGIVRAPLVMVVSPSFPARSVAEFIAYAKANPGRINVASAGNGSAPHVAGELFKMMAGVDMVHVPYRGAAPALTDLLGGQVQVMFETLPASIEHIRTGRLRALAVSATARSAFLPDLRPLSDFLPGYEATVWYGIGAPRNTPAAIVDKLNASINAILADPGTTARFADLGGTVFATSVAEFGQFIAAETEKWAKVVRFSGAKAE